MEDLILSRIDYGLMAFFIVALLIIVVFIVSKHSKPLIERPKQPVRSLITRLLKQNQEQIIASGFIIALLSFFVFVTLLDLSTQSSRLMRQKKMSVRS
jgi:flagellar biosynthesis protein FlhB